MVKKNERSRCWNLVLYPEEDKTHTEALEFIRKHYSYAYIVHDKDYNEDGEILKSHVHVVVRFSNARSKNGLAVELGIAPNYIEKSNSLDNSLLYLIHYHNDNKFQYEVEEVHGDLIFELKKAINKLKLDTEDKSISVIMEFIEQYPETLKQRVFCKWVLTNGLWSVYRRNSFVVNSLINEHNSDLFKLEMYGSSNVEG